jgi:hypothetical protein
MAADQDLVSLLMQGLQITQKQAEGGAGAIFSQAKQKLSPEEFTKVAATVPNMDTLLKAAPKEAASGFLGQSAMSLLGSQGGSLANLAGSFSQLGLGPDMVGQFTKIILPYVESKGGSTVSALLASVVGVGKS